MIRIVKAFLPPCTVAGIASVFILFSLGHSVRIGETSIEKAPLLGGFVCGLVLFAACLFFLPVIIAGLRDSPSYGGVLVVNVVGSLFMGIGWLIALVWACFDRRQTVIVQQHIHHLPGSAAGSPPDRL